ncbi:MAG TPA: MlaE family lipid ABC transporter permease subunit [Candidatus Deferrimicrobiaceae bacterium]|nr:MlaE family lipid ABC transporter permease subunit [Candidatus Deferrimicrobiaceae bacterium]
MSFAETLGRKALGAVNRMGKMTIFLCATAAALLAPPYRVRRIVKQVHFIGGKSLFVIVLTAAFTGMVLGLQGYYTLRKFGSEGLLGSAVALSLIRELGPVLSALMVTGRAGSALTAEIGIMRIGEQIDSLESMGIDPVKFLVAPRLLGAVLSVPLLTAVFDVVGILGGYLVGVKLLGVNSGAFFGQMEASVEWKDVMNGIIKSVAFGLIIAWVCTFQGYYAERGAEGVSQSTTSAVVLSSVLVLIGDYVLTSVLL